MSRAQVVIASVSSPWGPVRIAAGPAGVVAVEMLGTAEGFAAGLERRRFVTGTPSGNEEAAAQARRAVAIIAALLAGEEADAAAVPIDIGDRPTWDRLVLDAVRAIPRGSTAGYGEVARRVGRPGAARAVGGAVGRNPVGLLVPCHRVIAGDGTLGGYGAAAWGGREAALDLKRALLALEGVEVRGRVGARVGDLTAAV